MKAPPRRRTTTRRQHWRRSRRGQVAAIATIFGLMLIVTFIAEFILVPLPAQEQNQELQHTLQVENQVGFIQAAITAGAPQPGVPLSAVEPITLGSQGLPPFGQASPGQLSLRPSGTGVTVKLPTVTGGPNWGVGNLCNTFTTSGNRTTCTYNVNGCTAPPSTWNVSITHQSYYFDLKGNTGGCQTINVTGDYNFIMVNETANNMVPPLNFTLFGSHNNLTVNWEGGKGSQLNFTLFGSYNTYQYGTKFNGKGATVITKFIGELEPPGPTGCPYSNLAVTTDKVGKLTAVSSGDTQSLQFYNSLGTVNTHGPLGSMPAITWQNVTQTASISNCAWGAGKPTGINFPLLGTGALLVLLQNHYLQAETVALEGGAVVAGVAGAPAIMSSGPPFAFSATPSGLFARLTLISLIGNPPTDQGYSTAGVSTSVVSNSTTTLTVGAQIGRIAFAAPQLLVNTSFPNAWANYFAGVSNFTTGGVSCAHSGIFASPYTCLDPPPGAIVTLTVTLNVVSFSVTSLLVKVAFY